MTRVFDGEVEIDYGQCYVIDDYVDPDLDEAFAGQINGLCGAAAAGLLFLITGLHSGEVPFAVDVLGESAPLDDCWEDAVEVSFTASHSEVVLMSWGGESVCPIPLPGPGTYRVRYSARGLDTVRTQDTHLEPQADRYLLQFWPGPVQDDAILRQSSKQAAYWHGVARELPPPPTPDERAAAERAAAERARREQEVVAARIEREQWGGRAPSDRLRCLGGSVISVARSDRDLLDAFESLDAATQRAAARWFARRACEQAEIDTVDWVAPALDAMDRGEALPEPFTDRKQVHALLARGPVTHHVRLVDEARPCPEPVHRPSVAVTAVFGALAEDPLRALVDAFNEAAATFENEREALVAEVRVRFIH